MADTTPEPTKAKRRLRATDETVRERAAKAQVQEAQPTRKHRIFSVLIIPLRPIGKVLRPVGKALRFVTPPYFRNAWRELRQVTWPNAKQSRQLTGAVVIFSIIFGAIIAIVDLGLDKVFKKVILKQ